MTSEPTPETPVNPGPTLAVRQRLVLSWLSLTWERLWIRLWLPVTGLGVFLAVALTDVLSILPDVLHLVLVVAAFAAIGYFAWRNLRTFALPTREEARTKLESSSPVGHRPLTTVEDDLAPGSNPIQQLLWRIHQTRARDDLERLRAPLPAPGVAKRDPFAARAIVILALFVTLVGGWGDVANRMWRTVLPSFGQSNAATTIKLWVTPPGYTNRSPLYLEIPPAEGTIPPDVLEIPAGSKALAVVTGARRDIDIIMGATSAKLERLADESQRGEADLTPGDRLELRQSGRLLAGWNVKWIPDTAPTIAFVGKPSEAPRWRLKVDYRAADDYGIQDVTAHMTRADAAAGDEAPMDVQLTVPPFSPKTVAQASVNDLTSHPWAGLDVKIQLVATDAAGQKGRSEVMAGKLPERVFTHPVSKELAKQRKSLMTDATHAAEPALQSITQILQKPESFNGDPLVHLALSATKYRLAYEPAADAAKSTPDLLWNAAVRIEDGNLAVAEQRLKDAEQALKEALERGAPQEEINRLVDELQQALADYSKAQAENKQDSSFSNAMNQAAQDANEMMEQLKQASETGSDKAMKDALNQLQKQLQEMRQQADGDPNNSDVKAAQNMMKQMREMAKEQSKQLDENFKKAQEQTEREEKEAAKNQGRRGPPEKHPGQSPEENAREQQQKADQAAGAKAAANQEALRKQLADLMDQMKKMTGEAPDSLGEAEQAMSEARDSLKVASFKTGVEGQSKALQKLQQGMDEASQQMAQNLFERGLGGLVQLPGSTQLHFGAGERTGRANSEDIEVPTGPETEGMAQRVRVILEEIRARASDRTRPTEEQDYLRRLMKKF